MSLKGLEKRSIAEIIAGQYKIPEAPKPVSFVVPEGTVYGDSTDRVISPRMLDPVMHKHHMCLWCSEMKGVVGVQPVVMFSTKPAHQGGYVAGTHDGIRDESRSGHTDFSGLRVLYCSIQLWIEAGNSDIR